MLFISQIKYYFCTDNSKSIIDLYYYTLVNQVNMKTIKSPADLKKIKEEFREKMSAKEKIRVRVHMGTSGQASGAKEIYEFLKVELEKRNVDATVISTGDMGYSFAEPTTRGKTSRQKHPWSLGMSTSSKLTRLSKNISGTVN